MKAITSAAKTVVQSKRCCSCCCCCCCCCCSSSSFSDMLFKGILFPVKKKNSRCLLGSSSNNIFPLINVGHSPFIFFHPFFALNGCFLLLPVAMHHIEFYCFLLFFFCFTYCYKIVYFCYLCFLRGGSISEDGQFCFLPKKCDFSPFPSHSTG